MIGSLISAWDVYWVMQLDTIGIAMFVISILGLFAVVPSFLVWLVDNSIPGWIPGLIIPAWALAVLLAIFLPSSKTAAAMIILPVLTSEQVVEPVSREFGEIYALAKIGLANLVTEDAAKTVEEQETADEDAE